MKRHHLSGATWLTLLFAVVALYLSVTGHASVTGAPGQPGTPAILVHPWDRTFTCAPAPAPGMALAPPPGGYRDGRFFGADRAPCAGYDEPGSPRGPMWPGPSIAPAP